MAFIDTTYFIDELNLPTNSLQANTLTTWIARLENKYLYEAMGYGFARLFLAGVTAVEQRWLDIRDGKEYTVNDVLYKWIGFANAEKRSPIANYVYIDYQLYLQTLTVATGEKKPVAQNSTNATVSNKVHIASIGLNEMTHSLHHFLQNNLTTYPEWSTSHHACFSSSVNGFDL